MTIPSDTRQWLPASQAAALAELPLKTIMRLGKRRLISVRKIPGTRPHYSRADVERLSIDYTFPRASAPALSDCGDQDREAITAT
jgi:hypothetical protein